MIHKAGRKIPEEISKDTGKKPFEGTYVYDNYEYKKAASTVLVLSDPRQSKRGDAQYADKVVAVTDCLVPFSSIPTSGLRLCGRCYWKSG